MPIDISKLSSAELKALALKIQSRIIEVEKETLQKALNEMHAVSNRLGVSFEDVIALQRSKARKSNIKSSAKYFNPDNPKQTWSGRGRKPAWFVSAIENGSSIADLMS